MNLVYSVKDKPSFGTTLVCAFQQLLAILAATIAVPTIIGNGMSQASALFGAGMGTIVYLCFTGFKSPVFLGSSFAFLGSMSAAFAGASTVALGYAGLIVGATSAGLVYIILSFLISKFGTDWIHQVMPPVVIGPTVAIIGLSLAGNAVSDLNSQGYKGLICGLIALIVTVITSVYGTKFLKLIPFIIGIGAGYIASLLMGLVDFSAFENMKWIPEFTFMVGKGTVLTWQYILTVMVAYMPVAFVVFAEHIADHLNLSSIIGTDLTQDPGLVSTLLGDGVGSIVGAIFGGCPNTTYGESVSCTAISGNASVYVTFTTAILAIITSLIAPFTAFLSTIPTFVMGGICFTLYGFIAVSGLKMIQTVDLGDNANLFTVASILVAGVGGLVINFGKVTLTSVACALILGIIINVITKGKKNV